MYLTGNPVGPDGSTDPRDLSDNAQILDVIATDTSKMETPSRLGDPLATIAGLKQMVIDYLAAQGFEPIHLLYVDGQPLTVLRPTQLIDRDGSVYRVRMPSTFPVTLTGTWATDAPRLIDVGDEALRQALASNGGAGLVGSSNGLTVDQRLKNSDVEIDNLQEALSVLSAESVAYASTSGLPGPNVSTALNFLGRAGKDGLFSTPTELGHRVGQLAYAIRADGQARLTTSLARYLPFGFEVPDSGVSVPGKKAYYVSPAGVASNDGLSWATAIPSISVALAKPDVDIVYVAGGASGIYMDSVHVGVAGQNIGAYTGSRNVAIVAVGGRATLINAPIQSVTAWATTGAANVYTKSIPAGEYTAGVVALTHVDKFGLPLMLTEVADTQAVAATPGSYCRLTSALYVRMPDNSVPDGALVRSTSVNSMRIGAAGAKVYLRGLDFIGGDTASLLARGGNAASTLYCRDCRFVGARGGNAYTVESLGLSILVDCMAGKSGNDAFNYHAYEGVVPHFVELNCIGVNGMAAGTGNGSTSHETCVGFRLGCNYAENAGPGVADVNDAKTYNVAIVSNDNGPSGSAGGFTAQADSPTAGGCIMWLHRCSAAGNPGGDFRARVNGRIRVRDCQAVVISAASGGTITPF